MPKRCLIITSQLAKNGTETFIMNVLKNIDRTKLMFDFYLEKNKHDGYYDEAIALGCNIFEHKYRRKNYFLYLKEIRDFFRENSSKYCSVYFHGNSFTNMEAISIAKKFNISKRIVHIHNSSTVGIHNKLLHLINRFRLHKLATDYLACSESARVWGYKNTPIYSQSKVIKNGISLGNFLYNESLRILKRKELGLADELVIGCIGRLTDVKNPFFSVNVLSELKRINSKVKLLFIGDGELKSELFNVVERNGLSDNIQFLGVRNDVPALMQAIDCLLLPSKYEGFPFVVVEAQAANLPIFVSECVSKEIILSENIHFLSIEDDPNHWAQVIDKNCPKRVTPLIDQRVVQFDIRTIAIEIEKLILT